MWKQQQMWEFDIIKADLVRLGLLLSESDSRKRKPEPQASQIRRAGSQLTRLCWIRITAATGDSGACVAASANTWSCHHVFASRQITLMGNKCGEAEPDVALLRVGRFGAELQVGRRFAGRRRNSRCVKRIDFFFQSVLMREASSLPSECGFLS